MLRALNSLRNFCSWKHLTVIEDMSRGYNLFSTTFYIRLWRRNVDISIYQVWQTSLSLIAEHLVWLID